MTSPAARTPQRACIECGGAYEPSRHGTEFCSTTCRKDFNNRRLTRGAELYDLYMAHRFERPEAKRLGLFQAINRLASKYREEDKARRAGRRSWRPAAQVLASRIYLTAVRSWTRAGR